jgi:hypothetical protein
LRNVLLAAIPFADDRHTAENVQARTLAALVGLGLKDPATEVACCIQASA